MLRDVLRIGLALFSAVLAAVGTGVALGLPVTTNLDASGVAIWPLIAVAAGYFPFVLLAAFIAVTTAEFLSLRHWIYWVFAGCFTAICGFHALQFSGTAAQGMFVSPAQFKFLSMGAVGGLVYWMLAGRRAGDLAEKATRFYDIHTLDAKQERRRCVFCVLAWLLLGLIPLGFLSWTVLYQGEAPLAARLVRSAENDAKHLLSRAGLSDVAMRVDYHTGRVVGTVADAAAKSRTFEAAKAALAPMVGLPGVVAVLQNDLLAVDDTDPIVAAENARIKLAEAEVARQKAEELRVAAEVEAKRKAEEDAARQKAEEVRLAAEAEAKRKAEEDAARQKAEEVRLAAEAEAKRKAEEEAARQKAEEVRLAAEAEAKRKAEEDAARQKAEEVRVAAEAEAKRKVEEDAARQKAEEVRLAAEAEAKRKAEEEAARQKAEEVRLAAEAEAKRKAEEEAAHQKAEEARVAAEAEAKRMAEDEAARQKAEEVRVAAEAEAKRKAEEVAARQKAEEVRVAAETERIEAVRVEQYQACAAELLKLTTEQNILFRSGTSDLRPKHAKLLDAIAELSKNCSVMTIVIGGHSDFTGSEGLNQLLSEERAEAVRAALVERGVDSKQLETRAYSFRQPIDGKLRTYARKIERRAGFAAELRTAPATQ